MIQASELRIGNFVLDNDKVYCVEGISSGKFMDWNHEKKGSSFEISGMIENVVWSGDDFNPIPLTEEWLLKFGFEHLEYRDKWQKNKFHFQLEDPDNDGDGYGLLEMCLLVDGLPQIKYVHQLQNLYFALTGQELQLSNPSAQ